MSNGLGFNTHAAGYMSRVVRSGGSTPGLLVQQAIENLAVGLKINTSQVIAAYPFYGGTEESHAINLFGPKFTIAWQGTVTHNSNGVTGNGTDGLGLTGVNPAVHLTTSSLSLSLYSRTNSASDAVYDMGAFTNGNGVYLKCRTAAGALIASAGGTVTITGAVAASTGMFLVNRTASTFANTFRNGVVVASSVTGISGLPNVSYIAVCAIAGVGFGNRNIAFAMISRPIGHSTATALALYNAVQAYQTALSRAV